MHRKDEKVFEKLAYRVRAELWNDRDKLTLIFKHTGKLPDLCIVLVKDRDIEEEDRLRFEHMLHNQLPKEGFIISYQSNKLLLGDFFENAPFVKAFCSLLEKHNPFDGIGVLAAKLNEKNKQHFTFREASNLLADHNLLTLRSQLDQCPFISIHPITQRRQFIHPAFQKYFIGHEFNRFEASEFYGVFQLHENLNYAEYLDWEAIGNRSRAIAAEVAKIESQIKLAQKSHEYDKCLSLRNRLYSITALNRFILPFWPTFESVDLSFMDKKSLVNHEG